MKLIADVIDCPFKDVELIYDKETKRFINQCYSFDLYELYNIRIVDDLFQLSLDICGRSLKITTLSKPSYIHKENVYRYKNKLIIDIRDSYTEANDYYLNVGHVKSSSVFYFHTNKQLIKWVGKLIRCK